MICVLVFGGWELCGEEFCVQEFGGRVSGGQ